MEPWAWAERQFGSAALGDGRRTRRAVAVGAAMAEASAAGLPRQARSPAAAKAAYRLMDAEGVTHDALTAPHRAATRRAAEALGAAPVLFVQDDTQLDFTTHPALAGAGRVGGDRNRGFCLHPCLALDPRGGAVLGLAAQARWARTEPARPETRAKRARRTATSPSEADAWAGALTAVGRPPESALWVSVADRGADCFAHLAGARELGFHCLVRAAQDRALAGGGRRFGTVRALPAAASREVTGRGAGGRRVRRALSVAWAEVGLRSPQGAAGRRFGPDGLRVWAVRAGDGRGTEWVLLSTLPVASAADAGERLDWYGLRGAIEDDHKCLKTGCRLEASPLRTADRLGALLGFAAVVAVRLLQLREGARRDPDAPADAPEPARRLLAAALRAPPATVATRRGFWRGVARLGGFLGRTGDGEPGWQTLWHGWTRFQALREGARLAQELAQQCG